MGLDADRNHSDPSGAFPSVIIIVHLYTFSCFDSCDLKYISVSLPNQYVFHYVFKGLIPKVIAPLTSLALFAVSTHGTCG